MTLHRIEDDLGIRQHIGEYGIVKATVAGPDWIDRLELEPEAQAYLKKREAFRLFLRERGDELPI